jgi:hypothetical protein
MCTAGGTPVNPMCIVLGQGATTLTQKLGKKESLGHIDMGETIKISRTPVKGRELWIIWKWFQVIFPEDSLMCLRVKTKCKPPIFRGRVGSDGYMN